METTTIIEIISLTIGGGGIIGAAIGFATFKWMKLKAKAEAKGAEAEAEMKQQDIYQEVIDDLKKDRERMKEIRDEQETYIKELREERQRLRSEKKELRNENDNLRQTIIDLQDTQRDQGDKIARLGRMYKAMTPLICTNTNCRMRQSDIMDLVSDDSFDAVEQAKDNTKKKEKKEKK